jgi:CubicO group peptidase (beta-lactamase class C family)
MQLLSHTSGLPFLPAGRHNRINFTLDATLAEAVRVYGKEPLGAEPGARYLYSNMGIATAGRIVEVLSGMEYSQFVKSRILDPLGMKDSFFFPPADRQKRIAIVYTHDNGKLAESGERAQGGEVRRYRAGAKYAGPELALYSTAEDLFHFYQMLANKGEWGGRRLLSRQAVAAMTQDYSPDHTGYGLGVAVRQGTGPLLSLLSPGTFGHGGAFGTAGWVDPTKNLVIVFLTQMTDGAGERARAATVQLAEAGTE